MVFVSYFIWNLPDFIEILKNSLPSKNYETASSRIPDTANSQNLRDSAASKMQGNYEYF